MRRVVEAYQSRSNDGNVVTIPEVTLYRCDKCDEVLLPAPSLRKISEYEANELEQLSAAQIHGIFDRADVTQKDFTSALGLGEKTFHRWLKGTQTVSRSMGYYLRAVDHFPEVFAWINDRKWRTPERKVARVSQRSVVVFPALAKREASGLIEASLSPGANPARSFVLDVVPHSSR